MALDKPRLHRDLVREVPELGEDFGLDLVLGRFHEFAVERVLSSEAQTRRRCVEFAAWGANAAPPAPPLPNSLTLVPEFYEYLAVMESPGRPRSAAELLDELVTRIPEMGQQWPLLYITERFAEFMWSQLRSGADADLLRRCFAWVERLAASDDPELRSLVLIDVLEMAPGGLRAGRWLGPATRALLDSAPPTIGLPPELGL